MNMKKRRYEKKNQKIKTCLKQTDEMERAHENTAMEQAVRQVEEQSEECDITVKHGQWEKRYHRHILMKCPFFECALTNDFRERNTGIINLSSGNPLTIDMALMFLYGQKPILDDTNIETMIDLADFLQLENLKSISVAWLCEQDITEENCIDLLELSRRYRFKLSKCIKYFKGNLHKVLLQPSAVSLSVEPLEHIFTEKRFNYLQMEDRLRFLVRWFIGQPETRKEKTIQLLETVDFRDISADCLDTLKSDNRIRDLLKDIDCKLEDKGQMCEVFLFPPRDSFLCCYDIERDTWFKFPEDTLKVLTDNYYTLNRILSDESGLYIPKLYGDSPQFDKIDFEMNSRKSYKLVTDNNKPIRAASVMGVGNGLCVVCGPALNTTDTFLQKVSSFPNGSSEILSVFIGRVTESIIQMKHLLSIPNVDRYCSIVLNQDSVVAFLPNFQDFVLLYDTDECKMEKIQLGSSGKRRRVVPTEDGFCIFDIRGPESFRIMQNKSYSGPLSQRYEIKKYLLNYRDKIQKPRCFRPPELYYLCHDNTWFRCGVGSTRFQCTDQSNIEEAATPDEDKWEIVKWKDLSVPESLSPLLFRTGEWKHFWLPRRMLRCTFNCPHCAFNRHKSENDIYDDDDDDDDKESDDYDNYNDEYYHHYKS